jgi:glutaredoxin
MKEVVIYTKEGCSLCDKAKEIIERVGREVDFTFRQVDITTEEGLFEKYRYTIPVVAIDGVERFRYKVSERNLRKLLRRS